MKSSMQTQEGAVLIVALIILLAMTLIGVTTMRTANLEEKMSANNMNNNKSLHASESAVDAALRDTNNIVTALNSGTTVNIPVDLGDTNIVASADITYKSNTRAPGYSFGNNQGTFSTYNFEAIGTGTVPAVKAKTITGHGAYRLGPGI